LFDGVNALTTLDGLVGAGTTLTIAGGTLTGASTLTFNGAAEADGSFIVTGGAGADTITGGAGADTITGGAGADTITGGAGADTITGGAGNDTLTGGLGADIFAFTGASITTDGVDTITDFTIADDVISFTDTGVEILNAGLSFIAGVGTLAGLGADDQSLVNVFVITDTQTQTGAGIQAMIDVINDVNGANLANIGDGVFFISSDNVTTSVWYDNDSATGDAVEIATLTGITLAQLATLTAANFAII
jgi:Ca2+-binding RTX toxin-like protein